MSKNNENTVPNKDDEQPYFGVILAFISLVFGFVLFVAWDSFGPEVLMKMIGMFFVLFGICGFGVEITNKIKNDGALELAIGLSMSLSILMLNNTFAGFPNLLSLIIGAVALLFVLVSIFRFVPKYNSNRLFEDSTLEDGAKTFYKWLLIIGNMSGAVVSIYNLVEIAFLK